MREQVVRALINKGLRLFQIGKSVDMIAVYDELGRRFGGESTPAVRELVTSALVFKGRIQAGLNT